MNAPDDLPVEAGDALASSGAKKLQALNVQLREQADRLRELNRELVDREQRLRLAIETGRVGVWVWDATGSVHTLDWSWRLKDIFGLPPETEVTRDIFLACVHAEDRERVDWAILQSLAGVNQGFYQIEYCIVHPADGSQHWVTAQGQAFFNASGESIRFIGAVVDISDRKQVEEYTARLNRELEERIAQRTSDLESANRILLGEVEERRKAERALRQSEEYFRKAIDTIPGLVWSSLPDGHIDYLNERWLAYTGLSLHEASGWGWQAAVHPDDLPGLVTYWKSILALKEPGEYEARLRRFDGQYHWFLFRGVPLRDEQQNLIKWYGTNIDIEDRRASEHLARGQLEALTETLTSLSQESEPEKFLEHVLKTMGRQLSAHSLSVWQLDDQVGRLGIIAIYENNRLRLATPEERGTVQAGIPQHDHPVWTKFFVRGEYCVLGNWEGDQVRVRLAEDSEESWFDWKGDIVANAATTFRYIGQLAALGVKATLCVPTIVSGRVTGMISIRFQQKRIFTRQEIDLARALAHQAMLALQLMRLSRQSREAAVIAERNRLAQDLHDTLAQGLTGIIVQLAAAEDARSIGLAAEADRHEKRAGQLARDSLREARASARSLRPPALMERQLCSALADLIDNTTQGTSLSGKFTVEGELQQLPEGWEQNIFRMVQEGLANTLRHAQATQFQARLFFDAQKIHLQLSDNGSGFDPALLHEGMGLRGLKERTEGMGGTLIIDSKPGNGTSIYAVLPTIIPFPPS